MMGCLVKSGPQAPVSLLEMGHVCNQKSKGSTERPSDSIQHFFHSRHFDLSQQENHAWN